MHRAPARSTHGIGDHGVDHGVGSWASARLAPPVHLGSPLSNEKTLHL